MPARTRAAVAAGIAALVASALGVVPGGAAEAAAVIKPVEARGPKTLFPLDRYGPSRTDNAALKWSEQTLALIRGATLPPTAVSRVLAVVQTSVYDAWAAYDPVAVGTRLGGSLRRPATERTLANKTTAISFAAYRALFDLFPDPARRRVQPGGRLRGLHRVHPGQHTGRGQRQVPLAATAYRHYRAEVRDSPVEIRHAVRADRTRPVPGPRAGPAQGLRQAGQGHRQVQRQ